MHHSFLRLSLFISAGGFSRSRFSSAITLSVARANRKIAWVCCIRHCHLDGDIRKADYNGQTI